MKTNWVNEALDRATRTVRAWPAWMRRPEVRGIAERGHPIICGTSLPPDDEMFEFTAEGQLIAAHDENARLVRELERARSDTDFQRTTRMETEQAALAIRDENARLVEWNQRAKSLLESVRWRGRNEYGLVGYCIDCGTSPTNPQGHGVGCRAQALLDVPNVSVR